MFKAITPTDVLFLVSVTGFVTSEVIRRVRSSNSARIIGTVAWSVFAIFWAIEAIGHLPEQRYFLMLVSGSTGILSAYMVSLSLREIPPNREITTAFGVMGILFVPYQYILPIYHGVLRMVTAHTVRGLAIFGFNPTVEVGVTGQPTALRFAGVPFVQYNIVSACTGISAIVLFAGIIWAADAPVSRRIQTALATGILIYLLNILRTVVVGGALAGEWFAFTAPLIEPVFGVSDPALISFYFAEYLLAQVLIVVVLLWMYLQVIRRVPAIQEYVNELFSAVQSDWEAIQKFIRRNPEGHT